MVNARMAQLLLLMPFNYVHHLEAHLGRLGWINRIGCSRSEGDAGNRPRVGNGAQRGREHHEFDAGLELQRWRLRGGGQA